MTENINDRSKTEFASDEDPLKMHRTASNEITLVSEIPNIINNKNNIIAPGQRKTPVSILSDEFCEEQAFPFPVNEQHKLTFINKLYYAQN